jgi:hypothetical protein
MKSKLTLLGFIIFTALITFSMVACDSGSSPDIYGRWVNDRGEEVFFGLDGKVWWRNNTRAQSGAWLLFEGTWQFLSNSGDTWPIICDFGDHLDRGFSYMTGNIYYRNYGINERYARP